MVKMVIEENPQYDAHIACVEEKDGVGLYRLSVKNLTMEKPDELTVRFRLHADGAFSVWNPSCGTNRALWPEWRKSRHASRIASGAPVQTVIGMDGKNKLTVAVLDVKSPMDIGTGMSEDTAELCCAITFFTLPMQRFDQYETVIRIDTRAIRYEQAIREVGDWWETRYEKAQIPEVARMPVYSTWYSFHQALDMRELEIQCRMAKEMGMESIIVDDGWQTDDNNRGYAYCGDWEPTARKMGDMREFSDMVHRAGLKILLWFSVPFVGKHAGVWEQFADMTLQKPAMGCDCLDPRYKEVREYLVDTYVKAVTEWNLDGLKLDFIDSFVLSDQTPEQDERRDIAILEDAVETLLADIRAALVQVKPDICIEFRQTYTGPGVTACGNMLRVADCPADAIKNRVGSVDLRLLAGNTPVHSDMLLWDLEEAAETAALQIINALFCVPQISMRLEQLPKSHAAMLRYYMDLWLQYREVLLTGDLQAEHPEANYSLVRAAHDGKLVAAAYSGNVLPIDAAYDEMVFVNGTGGGRLLIDQAGDGQSWHYTITACTGQVIACGETAPQDGVLGFSVPPSGVLVLNK